MEATSSTGCGDYLVTGRHVLSMDATIGDLPSGDVLVRDRSIVAVADHIDAPDAQPISAKGAW